MTVETTTTETPAAAPAANGAKRGPGRPPKAAAAPAATVKRAGRPPAPQSLPDLLDAYSRKLQAARRAAYEARALLVRMSSLPADNDIDHAARARVNWGHVHDIGAQLVEVDYTLHAAQLAIGKTEFSSPTDKL